MTGGKSVGGGAPSAPYGYCTVQALVRKLPTINMTGGKSVGGKAPSAPYGYYFVQDLVRKRPTKNMTRGKVSPNSSFFHAPPNKSPPTQK